MRGFIRFFALCLFGCVLVGPVVAVAQDYIRWEGNYGGQCGFHSGPTPTALAQSICNTSACSGARTKLVSEYPGSGNGWTFGCTNPVTGGPMWRYISKKGVVCPAGETYNSALGGCTGPEPAPPAEPDGPCMAGGAPPGDNSPKVDPANCSIYAYRGRVPSSCRVGDSWQPCPCADGICNNYYCPTGEQKGDCVPAGWNPASPGVPYIPDPNQAKADGECTAAGGCGGSPPSSPPPPDAGQPDPGDPDGGSHGDVPQGGESTSTTGSDGTTTTSERTTTFNPYSGETVVRDRVTTTNPDGSTVVDDTKTTSRGTPGGGTSRTTTRTKTTTGADGSVSVETEGSTSETEGQEEEAPDNLASGGLDCGSEPSCTGDAIQCGILKQIWRDNCVFSKISGGDSCAAPPVCDSSQVSCAAALQSWHDRCPQGSPNQSAIDGAVDALVPGGDMTVSELDAAAASDPDYVPDSVVDLSSISIGPTNPSPSGSCPLPFSITVMGVDVAIGSTELCDFTDWISWLVRISASLFALFIITGYGVGRSTGGA